jgi:hypothetical protein
VVGHSPYASAALLGPPKIKKISKKSSSPEPFHLPFVRSSHLKLSEGGKDPLPRFESQPYFGLKGTDNFVSKNREHAYELTKSQSQARLLKGTKGLPKESMARKSQVVQAGRQREMPLFYRRVKAERAQKEIEGKAAVEREAAKLPENKDMYIVGEGRVQLDKGEQEALKENLKRKWTELNRQYQLLIHHNKFEESLRRKKEGIEKEIIKVEGYMKRLEKPLIFIDTKEEQPAGIRKVQSQIVLKL